MNVITRGWFYWTLVKGKLSKIPAPDINLFARLYIAKIFFLSGRTKAISTDHEGFWQSAVDYVTPAEHAIALFEEEYVLPILSPELAAQLALLAETFFPILLIFGLASRLSSTFLLVMTIVIQVFVYPSLWHEHMIWMTILLLIILRGGGKLSLDHVIVEKYVAHDLIDK